MNANEEKRTSQRKKRSNENEQREPFFLVFE